jgi:hypothetical protein
MQGGQGPLGPGRSIYIARRIVAGLVVLLVLALVGNWAWQSFHKPTPESASEAPESTSVSSSAEQTVTEEGSATSQEEIVVSKKAPQENAQVSTQGSTESPELIAMTPVTVAPVPEEPIVLSPVVLPVNTSLSEIAPPPISNTPPLPAPIPPQPSPPATAANEAMNHTIQVPSTAVQVPPSVATVPQQQMVQLTTLEEPVPFTEQTGFQEQPPLGETALAEQAQFEGPGLEAATSANVRVTGGNTVASAGTVTAMAG